MLPQPIIPRFFPVTSVPFIDDFSHFPSCVVLSAKGICLAVERIKVIACSAVVIEFPSYADAQKAYDSSDYKRALKELEGGADRDLRIVEGV